MNYWGLIKDAFRISWSNKFLWFFGFFVAGSTSFPSGGGNFGGGGDDFDFEQSGAAFPLTAQIGVDGGAVLIALLLGLVVLVLAVVFIVLALISRGALAESVAAIEGGQSRRFSSAWRAGVSHMWRVLGQALLFFLIGLGLLIVIGIPVALIVGGTFAATESVGLRVLAVVLGVLLGIALLIVVFIPLAVIGQYALRDLVVRGERVSASIGNGFRLFRGNIGRSFLLWLIQIGILLTAGIALLIAAAIVGLILFLPTIILSIAEYSTAAVITGIIAGIILIPLLIVASGALGTFKHAYWTLAYLRLTGSVPEQSAPRVV